MEQQFGCRLVVKVETLGPVRSFNGRGTEYLAASLDWRPHLVCATAGNFGQGMAYSARKRGLALMSLPKTSSGAPRPCRTHVAMLHALPLAK